MPSTHTAPAPAPARMVTTATPAAPPLPFTANQPPSRIGLVPWWSLLLSALALSLLGAVTAWRSLPPVIGAAVTVSMSACCLMLVIAELVHRATSYRPSR